LEPPVPHQGARRVWSDSRGALWITGWNSGDLFVTIRKDGHPTYLQRIFLEFLRGQTMLRAAE
jgi:hypothetical protein